MNKPVAYRICTCPWRQRLGRGISWLYADRGRIASPVVDPLHYNSSRMCIYDMLKQSTKESNKLETFDISLGMYQDNIYYNEDAIKRSNCRIYKKDALDR